MTNWIWITTQFEGFHFYPNPPEGVFPYLKNVHRHLFKVKIWIQIFHDSREIEFFEVKRFITKKLWRKLRVDTKSCEMVCDWIYGNLSIKYGHHRKYRISVSEDGENGAEKEYGGNPL